MNGEQVKISKEAVVGYLKELSQHSCGETKINL
jgi:hypothetical protein